MNLRKRTKTDKINTVIEDNKMSRTYRKTDGMHRYAYRFPHTFNEIRNLDGILNDDELLADIIEFLDEENIDINFND